MNRREKERAERDRLAELYPHTSNKELAVLFNTSARAIKNRAARYGFKKHGSPHAIIKTDTQPGEAEMKIPDEKVGMEQREGYVINWSTKQLLTDIGDGQDMVVMSFQIHGAIQRAYVDKKNGGEGETAAEIAMRFPQFPNAKAVYKYAKIHGFSKGSTPQTDLEYELGVSEEDAVKENVQTFKRRVYKQTQKRIWQEVQRDADKWVHFQDNSLHPLKDWIMENGPKYRPPKYKPTKKASPLAAVVGLSDLHFLKLAFDHLGNQTYNKEICEKLLYEANNSLITQMLKIGKPEVIYVPVGTDNLHVDNGNYTTTRGTPQHAQSDIGIWERDSRHYMRLMLDAVEMYAQIAPVVLVPMVGNHDDNVSHMLHSFFMLWFEDRKDVTVVDNTDPVVFQQYGKNAIGFTHGDGMSLTKQKRDAHKTFLYYARRQGIKDGQIIHRALFTGHLHFDSYEDLGEIKHFIIPSLSAADSWHKKSGYVGSKEEASLYLFDKEDGRKVVLYS